MLETVLSFFTTPVLAFIGGLVGYPITTKTFKWLGRQAARLFDSILKSLAAKAKAIEAELKD